MTHFLTLFCVVVFSPPPDPDVDVMDIEEGEEEEEEEGRVVETVANFEEQPLPLEDRVDAGRDAYHPRYRFMNWKVGATAVVCAAAVGTVFGALQTMNKGVLDKNQSSIVMIGSKISKAPNPSKSSKAPSSEPSASPSSSFEPSASPSTFCTGKGFTCGVNNSVLCGSCGSRGQSFCYSSTSDGTTVDGVFCAEAFQCANTPCPNGISDCPAGYICAINSCCPGPPQCTPECDDNNVNSILESESDAGSQFIHGDATSSGPFKPFGN